MSGNQPRNFKLALTRGLLGRCPHCGKGKLFGRFLKVNKACPDCGEELHHQRADDAPAYFVILIVGHIVVPLALMVENAFRPPHWVAFSIWIPLTLVLSLWLLQPVKGAIIGWQWSHRMHGFDPAHRDETDPLASTSK